MKLNKFAVKTVSVLVAVMLVSSQNVFASGRYMNVTENWIEDSFKDFSEYNEDSGSGGVFLVGMPVTLSIGSYTLFGENRAKMYGGAISLNNSNATVNIGEDSYFGYNSATYGGAINIDYGLMTIGSNVSFERNYTRANSQSTTVGGGGAIYNDGNLVMGDNICFYENYVNYDENCDGGAIQNSDNLTIGNYVTFENNYSDRGKGGAIYNQGNTNIGVARFTDNFAGQRGGAIYNEGVFTIDDSTAENQGTIFANNWTDKNGYGGAVYNTGSTAIFTMKNKFDEAVFIYNFAEINGGAIYNYLGTINIDNNVTFEGNFVNFYGSAIYNEQGIVNLGNNIIFYRNGRQGATQTGAGAIYNTGSGTDGNGIITIGSGTIFEENTSNSYGGAICNIDGSITIGDSSIFKNNSASGPGGAIFQETGTITIGSNALFQGNDSIVVGGAIGNGGTMIIGNNVKFVNNVVSDSGGAIYNENYGTITIGSNASFQDNQSFGSNGGAIYNNGIMAIGENAVFKNNSANRFGGAIYNFGKLTIEDGAKFIGNIVGSDYGGAIYNSARLDLIANTKNIEFIGNKHSVGTEEEVFNAIYNDSGQVNMWASNKADIIFNDSIEGNGEININKPIENYQENKGTGKIVLNADMSKYNGTVNFYGGTIELGKNGTLFGSNNGIKNIDVDNATINMANGKIANAEFGKEGDIVSIRKELNLTVDADLENKEMDMALFWGWPIEGKVNVKEINIIKDSDKTTRIDFAELDGNNKVITVNKARSVLYSYDAKLDYGEIKYELDGNLLSGNGYYYTFTKKGFNPVTAAGAISASVGGYATQSVVMGQAFASMDRQVAAKNQPTVAPKAATKPATKATNSKTTTNNTQNKKEDKKQAPKKDTKQQNKKTSYIQSSNLYVSAGDQVFAEPSKIERGAWLRPFILNETVKVGDTDVDNNLYGTLAGIDLPVKGDILASFYLGYAGSKQKVEEVKSNQTGYVLGATGMLIKDKWYAGLTANMIFNKASVDTDDGTNDIDMNMFTIGAKAGYNYDIGKNWILEPNVTLMYGIVNCGSYETTLTKVDSQSVNNILLEPQVKARWQLTNGWQPYGLLGYAANLSSKPTVKTEAGDLDLDSIGGYVEFGAGVNKDFVNTAWSCYAQITGRAAGRSGFEGNLGIKYKF